MTEDEAVEMMRVVLADAAEEGIIDEYKRCPGEPTFDVWPLDGDEETVIKVTVRP